ncbi:hypothetical protein [Luteimonas fraxinea]|uniref:hypothetical protein n=1 Tax=Luteimonas fraxinea TaxID=2901869 RepID=UPI001E29E11E|nr:hypothetical protein [Luteimonas fraxinea]MCD9126684.1 hypothetical protein [Luteimonas fraxinea]
MASNGWVGLGQMLGGGIGTPGAYEDGLMEGYKHEFAMQQARRETAAALIDTVRAQSFARTAEAGFGELGFRNQAQMNMALGDDPNNLTANVAKANELGWRQQAHTAAVDRYGSANPNAHLFPLAAGPQALGDVQEGVLYADRFAPGMGGGTLTPLGEASVEQRRASAASSYATANNANVRSGIAQGQHRAQMAGTWNPSGKAAANALGDSNRVYTFFQGGRQTTAVSPDGRHVFGADGSLVPMPPNAVAVSGARAIDELTRDNIRNEMDSALGELGASAPKPGADPYAAAVGSLSGPMASTLGRGFTYVAGIAGDQFRQPQRDAESYIDNVNQMVKSTLVNNPRFPQFEQRIVDRLLPTPGLSAGQQVTRANELRRVLDSQIEQKRGELPAADSVEARRINQEIRQLAGIVSYMNRGPASTRSGDQPTLGDSAPRQVRVPVSRNAAAPRQALPSAGGPAPGAVQDGYRFRGGNPADQSNWERVR